VEVANIGREPVALVREGHARRVCVVYAPAATTGVAFQSELAAGYHVMLWRSCTADDGTEWVLTPVAPVGVALVIGDPYVAYELDLDCDGTSEDPCEELRLAIEEATGEERDRAQAEYEACVGEGPPERG
jgi:hypothetical protein